MFASFVSLFVLIAPRAAPGGNLARLADVEVQGPVRDLVLDLGSTGETRLEGELLPGERSSTVVPLPLGASTTHVTPELRWSTDGSADDEGARRGRARFLGWREDTVGAEIESLPPGLRARSRPPLSPPQIRLPRASLALLPALLILGLGLRRRAAASWLVATLGSTVVLGLGWPRGERGERKVTVLEIDSASARGLSVRATWERADIPGGEIERSFVEISKEGARVFWTGSLNFPEAGAWRVVARGAALHVLQPFDSSTSVLHREENRSLELQQTWFREDGVWSEHGSWALGAPFPSARPSDNEGRAPPGWLSAGLPQGVPILLGRASPSADPSEVRWIRQTGF